MPIQIEKNRLPYLDLLRPKRVQDQKCSLIQQGASRVGHQFSVEIALEAKVESACCIDLPRFEHGIDKAFHDKNPHLITIFHETMTERRRQSLRWWCDLCLSFPEQNCVCATLARYLVGQSTLLSGTDSSDRTARGVSLHSQRSSIISEWQNDSLQKPYRATK